jgi:hypothetical protein
MTETPFEYEMVEKPEASRKLNAVNDPETSFELQVPRYPCVLRALPKEKLIAAAGTAVRINPANQPGTHLWAMSGMSTAAGMLTPEAVAVLTTKYWASSGVSLTVGFMEPIDQDLKDRILSHMNAWSAYGNISFTATTTDPQVRITRETGGYASYLGTDILHVDLSEATMFLQGITMDTEDSEFYRVVRHQTGHTLGFPHEHTRREIVDNIDPEKSIALFMRTQGWTRDQVIAQVLTPLYQSTLNAAPIDANSIMCYALPGSIMKNGQPVPAGTDIDAEDGSFAASIYPKTGSAPRIARGYPDMDRVPSAESIAGPLPMVYLNVRLLGSKNGTKWLEAGKTVTLLVSLALDRPTESLTGDESLAASAIQHLFEHSKLDVMLICADARITPARQELALPPDPDNSVRFDLTPLEGAKTLLVSVVLSIDGEPICRSDFKLRVVSGSAHAA